MPDPDPAAHALLDRMRGADVLAADCPSRAFLQHLTSRWGVLVMAVLATGTFRFAALRRQIGGVSERMLAQTLQQLEADGFVTRRDYGEVPPRVDYSLTEEGREAATHLVALAGWIEENLPRLMARQASHRASEDRSAPASA